MIECKINPDKYSHPGLFKSSGFIIQKEEILVFPLHIKILYKLIFENIEVDFQSVMPF